MSININLKPNYSYLFSSMNTNSSSASMSTFLSDYQSIKNGSYYKLMKAYYSKPEHLESHQSDAKKSANIDSVEDLSKVQSATDDLKEAADALLDTDFTSIDKDILSKKIEKFTESYNSVLSTTKDLNTVSVLSKTVSLIDKIKSNESSLNEVGISIHSDNTLSFDSEHLKETTTLKLESVFSGSSSLAYQVSSQASFLNFAATNAASKAPTYNINGSINNPFTQGNLFNRYF